MKRDLTIIITIIILIIIAHAITQVYTQNFFDSLSDDLKELENRIMEENISKEEAKQTIENIEGKWRNKYDIFAYFTEHDELEKVQTQLVSIKANIEMEQYNRAVDEIEKCRFILRHIENKDSLRLVNIF